jgi:L-arabinose isomerase
MHKPKIGLLPFYIKLYDQVVPDETRKFIAICHDVEDRLRKQGLDVVETALCMVRKDFENAVSFFEKQDADAIMTLHLSYSPSLESIGALAATTLPVIVLTTAPAYDFGPEQNLSEIMYNHGLAGIQDMCCMLKRMKKPFHLIGGYLKDRETLDTIYSWSMAAALAKRMKTTRVGVIGGYFEGMGDFFVQPGVLHSSIGIESVSFEASKLPPVSPEDWEIMVQAEIQHNKTIFNAENIRDDIHRLTVQSCLKVRRWLDHEKLTAFTINFLGITPDSGFETVPFLEASKAMARGIGYAGEGDALTASLIGTLTQYFPDTMFTEMFCIDWKNDTLFLSHMAEMNTNLVCGSAKLIEMKYRYTDVSNPVIAIGRYKSGCGVLVNLSPAGDNSYTLVVAPGEIMGIDGEDKMDSTVHGWFKPEIPVPEFIESFSNAGGTHHSAFVYGHAAADLTRFGVMMGWEVHEIRA